MRGFTGFTVMAVTPALLFASFPGAADAASDPGTASAVLKVGTAVLVSGIYVYNHFRVRIGGLLGGLVSRGRRS